MLPKSFVYWWYRAGHRAHVIYWFFARPHTSGVKCLVFYGESVLLVRPSYSHQKFSLPGGGVKRGESWADAATRELLEETGIQVELRYFGTYQQEIEYKHDTVQCFYAAVDDPTFRVDDNEIVEGGWFAVADLPDERTASVDRIITLYQEYSRAHEEVT